MGGVDPDGGFRDTDEGGRRLVPGETGYTAGASDPRNDVPADQQVRGTYWEQQQYNEEVKKQREAYRIAQQQEGSREWWEAETYRREETARENTVENPGAANASQETIDLLALAQQKAEQRPGYETDLGDSKTKILAAEIQRNNPGMTYTAAVGIALETQRQKSWETTTLTDDRFFLNGLEKWNQNKVELSEGYHELGMGVGVPIPANPFEYSGDLAVEALKGGPHKESEMFSPVSGEMVPYLPGGKGIQEVAWDSAVGYDKKPGEVTRFGDADFMPAILALNRAEGLYGPYGNLRGGIPDAPSDRLVGGKIVAGNITTQDALPRPFVSGIDSATTSVTKPTGEIPYFGVVPILSPAIAFFQPDTITKTNREAPMQVPNDGTDPFGGGAAFTNAFVVGGKKSDVWTYAAGEKKVSEPFPVGEPTVITVYNPKTGETTTQTTQQMGRTVSQQFETVTIPKTKTIVPTTTTVSTGQSGFDIFNKNISEKYVQPFTPTPEYATRSGYAFLHIRGEPTPEIQAGVKFFSEGFYGGIREKPATFGLSLGAGAALGTVWRGAGFVSSAVMPTIAKTAPRVAAGLQLGGKSLPYIFGGAVVVETGYRSTEGFTNYELSSVATKTGDIVGTEIMPGFAGFDVGYHVPEHATGLYRGAVQIPGKVSDFSTRVGETYRKLPTADQVRYKYLEWKSPSTAISQPMPSERFIRPSRNTGDMTGSAKGYFRARGYSEGFGSPRTGGSVSGRPTPRQESLKLNYNPTAPLTEIDVSGITPVIATRGKIGGVRGSLRGKWDTGGVTAEEPFSNLPLKQRWKMRSAESGKQQEPGRGYYGGGKPTGGLQSGVGIGGTTVRSGRGAFELAMPSSGLVGPEGESLSPKPWEVTPSRRTAQRSRAYDLDYEYAARKLPEGMQRPSSRTERISETSVVVKPEVVPSVAQVPAMKPGQAFRQSPVQSTDLQKDRIVSPIAIPTMAVGVISLSAIMQKQNPVQLQAPRQMLNQYQLPQMKTVSTTKIVDLTNVNRVTGYDKRVSIDTETRIKVDPIVPPVIPPLGPGGSSAPAGLGYDSKAWKKSNPVGADLMKTHKGGFRPMKKMKMPKFKIPKF